MYTEIYERRGVFFAQKGDQDLDDGEFQSVYVHRSGRRKALHDKGEQEHDSDEDGGCRRKTQSYKTIIVLHPLSDGVKAGLVSIGV